MNKINAARLSSNKATKQNYMGTYTSAGYVVYWFQNWTTKNNKVTGKRSDYYFKVTNYEKTYQRLSTLYTILQKVDEGASAISIHGYLTGIAQIDAVVNVVGSVYSMIYMCGLEKLVRNYMNKYYQKPNTYKLYKVKTKQYLSGVVLYEKTYYV